MNQQCDLFLPLFHRPDRKLCQLLIWVIALLLCSNMVLSDAVIDSTGQDATPDSAIDQAPNPAAVTVLENQPPVTTANTTKSAENAPPADTKQPPENPENQSLETSTSTNNKSLITRIKDVFDRFTDNEPDAPSVTSEQALTVVTSWHNRIDPSAQIDNPVTSPDNGDIPIVWLRSFTINGVPQDIAPNQTYTLIYPQQNLNQTPDKTSPLKLELNAIGISPGNVIERYYWQLNGQVQSQSTQTLALDQLTPGRHQLAIYVQDQQGWVSKPYQLTLKVVRPKLNIALSKPDMEAFKKATASYRFSLTLDDRGVPWEVESVAAMIKPILHQIDTALVDQPIRLELRQSETQGGRLLWLGQVDVNGGSIAWKIDPAAKQLTPSRYSIILKHQSDSLLSVFYPITYYPIEDIFSLNSLFLPPREFTDHLIIDQLLLDYLSLEQQQKFEIYPIEGTSQSLLTEYPLYLTKTATSPPCLWAHKTPKPWPDDIKINWRLSELNNPCTKPDTNNNDQNLAVIRQDLNTLSPKQQLWQQPGIILKPRKLKFQQQSLNFTALWQNLNASQPTVERLKSTTSSLGQVIFDGSGKKTIDFNGQTLTLGSNSHSASQMTHIITWLSEVEQVLALKLFDSKGQLLIEDLVAVGDKRTPSQLDYQFNTVSQGPWSLQLKPLVDGLSVPLNFQLTTWIDQPPLINIARVKKIYQRGELINFEVKLAPGVLVDKVTAQIESAVAGIQTIELRGADGGYYHGQTTLEKLGFYRILIKAKSRSSDLTLPPVVLTTQIEPSQALTVTVNQRTMTYPNKKKTKPFAVLLSASIDNPSAFAHSGKLIIRDPGRILQQTVIDIPANGQYTTAPFVWQAPISGSKITAQFYPDNSLKVLADTMTIAPDAKAIKVSVGADIRALCLTPLTVKASSNITTNTAQWYFDTNLNIDSDQDGIADNDVDVIGPFWQQPKGFAQPGQYTIKAWLTTDFGSYSDPLEINISSGPKCQIGPHQPTENTTVATGGTLAESGLNMVKRYLPQGDIILTLNPANPSNSLFVWDKDIQADSDLDGRADNDIDHIGTQLSLGDALTGPITAQLTHISPGMQRRYLIPLLADKTRCDVLVDPSDHLQAIIDSIPIAMTLCLTQGDYTQSLLIKQPGITLQCLDAKFKGDGRGVAINVLAQNVQIKDCHIENYTTGLAIGFNKTQEIKVNKIELSGNELRNNRYGIINRGQDSVIKNNHVKYNTIGVVDIGLNNRYLSNEINANQRYGVFLPSANNLTLVSNEICKNNQDIISKNNQFTKPVNSVCDQTRKGKNICVLNCQDIRQELPSNIDRSIHLAYGQYSVPKGLVVTRSNLSIQCQGATLIGEPGNNGMTINNKKNITINGCRFENFETGVSVINSENISLNNIATQDNYQGVEFINSKKSSLADSELADREIALFIDNASSSISVQNNKIENRDTNLAGMIIQGSRHNLLANVITTGTAIQGNSISLLSNELINQDQTPALSLEGQLHLIKRNTISSNYDGTDGIYASSLTRSELTDNSITATSALIRLENSSANELKANQGNLGEYGLWLVNSNDNSVIGNRFTGQTHLALGLVNSDDSVLEKNQIKNTTMGLLVVDSASASIIENDFMDVADFSMAFVDAPNNTLIDNQPELLNTYLVTTQSALMDFSLTKVMPGSTIRYDIPIDIGEAMEYEDVDWSWLVKDLQTGQLIQSTLGHYPPQSMTAMSYTYPQELRDYRVIFRTDAEKFVRDFMFKVSVDQNRPSQEGTLDSLDEAN